MSFKNSAQYWEDRYKLGGTSGSGSYGSLALFKAEVVNNFVKSNGISRVVEFGCGDGEQLRLMNFDTYLGFDISKTSIEMCREKFRDNEEYSFHLVGGEVFDNHDRSDLSLSLDVIYHLIEDDVFENYMRKLFDSSNKYIIIYAYSFYKIYDKKHEMGRDFLVWIANNIEGWKHVDTIKNRYPYEANNPDRTSQSDFFFFEKSKCTF